MAALATVEDVTARLGRTLTADEEAQCEVLLDDASAAVRSYTGQEFTLVTDDVVRLRARNGSVRLPQRPVVAVSAVATTEATTVDFTWDAGDTVAVSGLAPGARFDLEPFRVSDPWLDVTYSHGYTAVPVDIIGVVCQIAGRALGRPADSSGVIQEAIAGYSYSVGSASASGAFGMLLAERQVLDRYRRPIGLIRVGL